MRCQSKVNCNSQVCWRQGNLQELWLQKEEEDDGFDGCLGCENDKIWKQSLTMMSRSAVTLHTGAAMMCRWLFH